MTEIATFALFEYKNKRFIYAAARFFWNEGNKVGKSEIQNER